MTLSQVFKSITAKEWRLVISISLAMIIIGFAPLVYGWLATPPGQVFTGIHFAAPNDWFVYYSYLEQVRQGNFLFRDLFTAEPHMPVLNIFWLGVGLLAKILPRANNVLIFNGVKLIFIPLFYFVAYLFLAYIFSEIEKRKLALLLLSFSSGLGTLLIDRIIRYPFNFAAGQSNWPMDLWVPEANTFTTLYYSPHIIFSLTLIILIFFLTALFAENRRLAYGLAAGLCALALFAFHPFHVLLIFGVILIYFGLLTLRQKKIIRPYLFYYPIIFFCSLPAIAYYLYLLRFDAVTAIKAMQNMCFTPPFWLTLFSYGLILIFAGFGAYYLLLKVSGKNLSQRYLFIIVWPLVQFGLIYFPVNYQRRLSEGLHFPLVILATIGLFWLYELLATQKNKTAKFLYRQRYSLALIILIMLILSNLFQLAADFYIYQANPSSLAYLDKEVVTAAQWLKSVGRDEVIFNSSAGIINIIPAYSGRPVYVGHGVETPFFKQREQEVKWFFSKNRPEEIERQFLASRKISYIFYTDLEKSFGDFKPETKTYLKEVFANAKVKIYRVY